MRKALIESKHFDLWFDTDDIGIGITYTHALRTLFVRLIVIEICLSKNNDISEWVNYQNKYEV